MHSLHRSEDVQLERGVSFQGFLTNPGSLGALLNRWCCSVAVDSLRVIATALNADSARLAADEASVAASARSLRLLRALVVGFSSFLRNSQNNNLYSSE